MTGRSLFAAMVDKTVLLVAVVSAIIDLVAHTSRADTFWHAAVSTFEL